MQNPDETVRQAWQLVSNHWLNDPHTEPSNDTLPTMTMASISQPAQSKPFRLLLRTTAPIVSSDAAYLSPSGARFDPTNRNSTPIQTLMKPSMRDKLNQLIDRHLEINQLLQSPDVTDDIDNYRKLTRELSEITPVVETFQQYTQTEADIISAEEMLADPEMKAFANEEIQNGKERLEQLQVQLRTMLIPKDENDTRNVMLEIRAGTGGEESALFAGDLLRMYSRYAERRGWRVELMSESPSDLGGYREVIVELSGTDVYATMKFESGGHRVQRVPETETQGRIHTSACTVAVMPEAAEVGEVELNPADLRIDTFRASGAGGQHINKTDSAVAHHPHPDRHCGRMPDRPQPTPQQRKAMKVLVTRIRDAQVQAQHAEQAATRKSLVGSGRSFRAHPHLQFSARTHHRPPRQSDVVQNRCDDGRRLGRYVQRFGRRISGRTVDRIGRGLSRIHSVAHQKNPTRRRVLFYTANGDYIPLGHIVIERRLAGRSTTHTTHTREFGFQ